MNTTVSAPVPSPEFARLIEIEMKRIEAMCPKDSKED